MSKPIVFISKFRVREGRLEDFKRFFRQGSESIKAEKPGTVVFLSYLSEDSHEVAIVHVFPDSESMDLHVEGAQDRSKAAFEFIEPVGVELYGSPSDQVVKMFREREGAGAPLVMRPECIGGYLRLQ